MANDYSLPCFIWGKRHSLIQPSSFKKKSKLTVILFFVLTLVTSGSTYASLKDDLNVAFAKSDGDSGNGSGGDDSNKKSDSDSSDSNKKSDSDSSDSNKKSKSRNGGDEGKGDSDIGAGKGGSSDSSNGGGSSGSSTSTPPSASEQNTSPSEITSPPSEAPETQTQSTCPDGSLPDATGNCPSPAPEQNTASPSQTNQQTCPDGAAPDANGVCPMTTSEGAPPANPNIQQQSGKQPPMECTDITAEPQDLCSSAAPSTNTPQEQPTANMLTGGIQTAAPINSPPPPPSSEPFEGCPGHVIRNANRICLSPLSKDSPCAEGFHHDDASGKCVDNKILLADGTCAGGYSLENIDGKNTCNGKDVGPCPGNVARDANGVCFDLRPNMPCALDFHRDASGKCVDNTIPIGAGYCAYGYHIISTGMCAPNSMTLPDNTCYGGYHVVSKKLSKDGKTINTCYPNEFPISAGTCAKTWYFVAATNSCMPGLPVQPGGNCPQGYHKTLKNVKDKDNLCAADPDTLTKITTPSQPNQQPSQTGGGTTGSRAGTQPTGGGGGTGTGTMPATPQPSGQQLQPKPPYKVDDRFTSFSSKLPTTPDSVLSLDRLHTKVYDFLNRSKSSQVPDVISSLDPDPRSSKNTGVGQPIQTDKTGNLLGPHSSQLQRTPGSVLTQKPPDTVFSGPKSMPRGDVPLSNPEIVRAPNEEGARSADDPCIAVSYEECNFPYPISQDEICRNGIDDDHDGKVDEVPCSEVPGESKPRPSDGILTPIPGQPLGP